MGITACWTTIVTVEGILFFIRSRNKGKKWHKQR